MAILAALVTLIPLALAGTGPLVIGEGLGGLARVAAAALAAFGALWPLHRILDNVTPGSLTRHEFEEAIIRFLTGIGYVFFTAIMLIPFYVMVMTSLKSQQALLRNPLDFTIDFSKGWELLRSYHELIRDFDFTTYMWTSFYVSVLTVLITLLFAVPGTYAVARLRFRGRAALIRANRDLVALARVLGEDPSDPERWAAELETALPVIWNDDLQSYDARDLRTGCFANLPGSGPFLVWLAGVDKPVMERRLMAAWDQVRYRIPSSDPSMPGFDARRYWRGPSWPFMNALIAIGFHDAGPVAEAERLRRETADLIAKGGFYEYFDPYDGTPCGGGDFTWIAAVWLAWAGRE